MLKVRLESLFYWNLPEHFSQRNVSLRVNFWGEVFFWGDEIVRGGSFLGEGFLFLSGGFFVWGGFSEIIQTNFNIALSRVV